MLAKTNVQHRPRVSMTLRMRRQSRNPTLPDELARVKETIMTSASWPWKVWADPIRRSGPQICWNPVRGGASGVPLGGSDALGGTGVPSAPPAQERLLSGVRRRNSKGEALL